MNFSIYLLLGPLIAYAVKRKNAPDELGFWRLGVGLGAALFPLIADLVFSSFGPTWEARIVRGPFWSPLLWPVWAVGIAIFTQILSGYKWHRFLPIVLASLAGTWLLAFFTAEGIAPFAPFFTLRIKIPLIFTFDWLLFLFLFLGVIITVIVSSFRRDIARLTLLIAIGYLVVLSTFLMKASGVANRYERSLNLDVAQSYVLPQPMSPLNWRLIHIAEDGKLHDTRVNLFRDEPVKLHEHAKRSWRLKELYQPLDQAVWRIYSRLGRKLRGQDQAFVETSWKALQDSSYRWQTRFLVYRALVQYSNTRCIKWQDLRRIGAKRKWIGVYLTCLAPNGLDLYRADGKDKFTYVKTLKPQS